MDQKTRCQKCGHALKDHCDPPVRGNDEYDPGTFGVLLHCLPEYPMKGSSCGCNGFEPREKEPPSMGELAADAEMETGCAPEDAAQIAIEHLIDRAER